MQFSHDYVIAVAKAIEGPHSGKFITRERLNELRDVRWSMLSDQDKGVRLQEALAAIVQANAGHPLAMGTEHGNEEQSG